jgi:hypothetical protein
MVMLRLRGVVKKHGDMATERARDRLISHVFWKLDEHQTCICAFADGIMALSKSISHV